MSAVFQRRRLAIGVSDQSSLPHSTYSRATGNEACAIEFGRFLEQADGVAQPQKLFDLVCAFALNFDCPWIAYGSLTPDQKFLKPARRDPAVMLNYPDEWQQRYFEMGYAKIDPIIKASRKRAGTFSWSEVYNDASTTEDERRVFDEAAMFGLRSGISIPLHRPDGSFAVMSFSQVLTENSTIYPSHTWRLSLRLFNSVDSRGGEESIGLSQREKECIAWVAQGKTSWEIGKTVNFHVKNLMRKMKVSNRMAAVIKALNIGIIEL